MATQGRPPTIGMTAYVKEKDGGKRITDPQFAKVALEAGVAAKVTVGEAIVESLATGGYVEGASATYGIDKGQLYRWLKRGARATRLVLNKGGSIPRPDRPYVDFRDAVMRAEAVALTRAEAAHAQMALGGRTTTRTVEKRNAAGELLERTTTTEVLQPDVRALEWWMARRYRHLYGVAGELGDLGPEGEPEIPREDRARELGDALRDFMAGASAGKAAALEPPPAP